MPIWKNRTREPTITIINYLPNQTNHIDI